MSLRSCAGVLILRPKRMNPPGCSFRKRSAVLGVELKTWNADEQELTRITRWHKCVNTQLRVETK